MLAPQGSLLPAEFDLLLEAGFRRSGQVAYRPSCVGCAACIPLRVPVARFVSSRSQRRVARRNRDVVLEVGPVVADEARALLYARHARERGLSAEATPDLEAYAANFAASCTDSREVTYRVDGRLVAVSLLDVGASSVSSVYHYFDPDESGRSLGVFSVIAELEWAATQGFEWYYLGYWVNECRHLAYKANYLPHETRVDGTWTPREPPDDPTEPA